MAYRPTPKQELQRVSLQAASWLQEMQNQPGDEARAEFSAWLAASPTHVREFLLISMLDSHLSNHLDTAHAMDVDALVTQARASADVVALRPTDASHAPEAQPVRVATAPRKSSRPLAWRPRWTLGLGALSLWSGLAGGALAMAVAALAVPGLLGPLLGDGAEAVQYATSRGEQRTVALADGSTLQLGADSRVTVRLGAQRRELSLDAGDALFKVAHDTSRPFLVHAGRTTVRAVGTQFEVNRLPTGTSVMVLEGKVAVSARAQPLLERLSDSLKPVPAAAVTAKTYRTSLRSAEAPLQAGEQAQVARDGYALQMAPLDPVSARIIKEGRLVFRDSTLIDIAAQFNRYTQGQIVIESDSLQGQRYSGVFDTNDRDSFMQFLALDPSIQVLRSGDSYHVRRRAI